MGLFPRFARIKRQGTSRGGGPKPKRLTLETLETRALVTADLLTGVPLALYSSGDSTGADNSAVVANDSAPAAAQQADSPSPTFLMSYTIVPTLPDGTVIDQPLVVGQVFDLEILVQDLRGVPFPGVVSGTLDVAYDNSTVDPTGTITPGTNYPSPTGAPHGDTTSNQAQGIVSGVTGSQSFSGTPPALGGGPVLLDTIQMTATGAGTSQFIAQFSGGQVTALTSGTSANPSVGDAVTINTTDIQTAATPAAVTINAKPTFSVADATVTAGASAATMHFQLTLSAAQSYPVTLDYSTTVFGGSGDTAVAGTDFTPVNQQSIVVPANATTVDLPVTIAANTTFQPDKTFHLDVSLDNNSVGQADVARAEAQGTIQYTPPTVQVQPGVANESTSTTTLMQFQVSLSSASAEAVTLNYKAVSEAGDTAVGGTDISQPGVDYFAADSTTNDPQVPPITIAPGTTTATITIPIAAEPLTPAVKTFHLHLTATNATLDSQSVLGTINVTPPALDVTTQPPATTVAGNPFDVKIAVQNAQGAVDTSFNGNVTIALANNPNSATLGGTLTVAANQGIADFSDLFLDKVGTGYTLQGTAAAHTPVTTSALNLTSASAVLLVATVQPPSSVNAGSAFDVKITAEDQFGNVDTSFTGSVTIAQLGGPSGATLGGATPVNAVNGVADFPNLTLDKAGNGYTLQATKTGLTSATTNSFNVAAVAASQLIVTTQPPANVQAGQAFDVKVTAEDPSGNIDTSFTGSVTIAQKDGPSGTTLGGTLTVNAVNGVADFSDLTLNKAGAGFTVQASKTGLASATSSSFNVTAAAATQLAFTTPPASSVSVNATFDVKVSAEDQFGNVDTSFTGNVTMAIGTNPAGGTLGGTLTVAAVSGVADFPVLKLDKIGAGYTLQATGTGLTSATTTSFAVVASVPTSLAIATQPPSSIAVKSNFDVKVSVTDQLNNVVSSFTGNVTIALLGGPSGATLGGTLTVSAVNGVADFSDLNIDKVGTGYTLQATATGLTSKTTSTIAVVAAPATHLVVTTAPPSGVGAGKSFDVKVSAEDQFGNVDKSFTGSVAMAIGNNPASGTLGGTTSVAAVNGVADFATLALDKIGAGYTLQATFTGLTAATTGAIDVLPLVVILPATANASTAHSMNFTVQLQDANGNPFVATENVAIQYQTQTQATDNAAFGSLAALPTNSVDYYAANSTTNDPNAPPLIIHTLETQGTISIPIAVELAGSDRTFHVNLTSTSAGGALGATTSAIGTIHDDIAPPSVSIAATASANEPSAVSTNMTFTVTLSAADTGPITVNYTIADGTAKAGIDYTPPTGGTGSVTIPVSATTATFTVPILVNPNAGSNPTFTVTLALPSGATNVTLDASHATSTGTIFTRGNFTGFAYVDTNNDGIEQTGEHPLAGVAITLTGTTAAGAAVQVVQTTGADGSYNFATLLPGNYTVAETPLAQYTVGKATGAAGVSVTSNTQFSFVVAAGSNFTSNDFGARGLQPQLITKRLFLASARG